MKTLTDRDARLRALTDHQSTLLVEAGAGTGKTSLMAGRVTMLLASGVEPRSVAAITFTELAASELLVRIAQFVQDLLAGEVPADLRPALPHGLSEVQHEALARARDALDELTCTTIHGFCKILITPYPVEAGIDPGARVADETEAQMLFDALYETWLRDKLDSHAELSAALRMLLWPDTKKGLKTVADLAEFFRHHRHARAARPAGEVEAWRSLLAAIRAFQLWYEGLGVSEPTTSALVGRLCVLASFEPTTDFSNLWNLGHEACEIPASYRCKQKWEKAATDAGRPKADGATWNDQAAALHVEVVAAIKTFQGSLADTMLGRLADLFGDLLAQYQASKRSAALLDFDDLLHSARDLVRDHPSVRQALADRFRHILVDEFQDTDPLQAEILFLLVGTGAPHTPWAEQPLRPGRLFIVGDPKQAIYRFRGADIATYLRAREAVETAPDGGVLAITNNFRSLSPILDHVNDCFQVPLSAPGQPGFEPIRATVEGGAGDLPSVVRLDVGREEFDAKLARDAEARAVARLCHHLIGSFPVRDRSGGLRPCRAGDIALLAPTGSELWVYERALEEWQVPITTQAGKALYRRQEMQDLLAVARVLADPRDTLALGALLRGPLVGLAEEELLDIVAGLEQESDTSLPILRLWTDLDRVAHPVARQVLETLQQLSRIRYTTTPSLLLGEAVDRLRVRPILLARCGSHAPRALANVDLFLEMARPYSVRGLRAFVRDQMQRWKDEKRVPEGRPDEDGEAVHLVTIHSAKGLEWPVVVIINSATKVFRPDSFIHRRCDETLHMPVGGFTSSKYAEVLAEENAEQQRERQRLWYVACTRPRDLLVLPRLTPAPAASSWAHLVPLGLEGLPPFTLDEDPGTVAAFAPSGPPGRRPGEIPAAPPPRPPVVPEKVGNEQAPDVFAQEAERIASATPRVRWRRPSQHDDDRSASLDRDRLPEESLPEEDGLPAEQDGAPEPPAREEPVRPGPEPAAVQGGFLRGTILHKLLEEVLTGELEEDPATVEARAARLLRQLGKEADADPQSGFHPAEMAQAVAWALSCPDVKAVRERLVPELAVHGCGRDDDGTECLTSGRADAVAVNASGAIDVVVDWKSDRAPAPEHRAQYRQQVEAYAKEVGASQGLLVYLTARFTESWAIAAPVSPVSAQGGTP